MAGRSPPFAGPLVLPVQINGIRVPGTHQVVTEIPEVERLPYNCGLHQSLGTTGGEQYFRLHQKGVQRNAGTIEPRARRKRQGNHVRFRRRYLAGGEWCTGCDGGRGRRVELALISN